MCSISLRCKDIFAFDLSDSRRSTIWFRTSSSLSLTTRFITGDGPKHKPVTTPKQTPCVPFSRLSLTLPTSKDHTYSCKKNVRLVTWKVLWRHLGLNPSNPHNRGKMLIFCEYSDDCRTDLPCPYSTHVILKVTSSLKGACDLFLSTSPGPSVSSAQPWKQMKILSHFSDTPVLRSANIVLLTGLLSY
jgi:hypothetical protein